MKETLGRDSTPSFGSMDKSRVLDVRPLRSLVPIFPSQPNFTPFATPQGGAPFVCTTPSGPFPPGTAPFYPFYGMQEGASHGESTPTQTTHPLNFNAPVSDAVPITSFRAPSSPGDTAIPVQSTPASNGDISSSRRTSRRKAKLISPDFESNGGLVRSQQKGADPEVDQILHSFNLILLGATRTSDGDKEAVGYILMIYDLLRRKIAQIEDSKGRSTSALRRPDLKAGSIMMTRNIRTNAIKRMGAVPGVQVGDIYFFRFELCLVGLHSPSMAGIDYLKLALEEEPVAVSIVSSGGPYEDDVEDGNVLIYSGQGGNMDQKLERGNLALKNSLGKNSEVRVIRGVRDFASAAGKIYVYDGLYKVSESWVEKGNSGFNVFKYKLMRLTGQPEAFVTWKIVQQWKDGITSRNGIMLPDITSSAETLPVCLVNDVDSSKEPPANFTYFPTVKYVYQENSVEPYGGCSCVGGCLPGNRNCDCIQKNRGYLPYTSNGVITNIEKLIYECGPSCGCPPNCKNRVTQGGLKVRLEVFKTKDKGWGVRSWDPIRGGAYICEFAGEAIENSKIEEVDNGMNDYLFDATRTRLPVLPGCSDEDPKMPASLTINSKSMGNVARFMNHNCSPTVFWHPILRANKKGLGLHIVFHAIRHIPPMTELTYDYGMPRHEKINRRKKLCFCRSSNCRGFFH